MSRVAFPAARLAARWPLALLGLLAAPVVMAQAEEAPAEAWRFQATPYVWMSGLQGDVRPFAAAPTLAVDKSFSELLESLETAAFLTGTARRGHWVLQGDLTHASTADSALLPIGLPASARVRQTTASLTAGHAWRDDPQTGIDLLAGIRHWDVRASVAAPGLGAARSQATFVDPVVAVRWRQALAPRWSSLAYAEVGGLGLGSELSWQLLALANYRARENLFVSMGYRHQQLDYRQRGKRLDVALSGPMLGVTWVFGHGRGDAPL